MRRTGWIRRAAAGQSNRSEESEIARRRHCIPEPVVACLRAARQPSDEEIIAVATQIWRDVHPDRPPWLRAEDYAADRRTILSAAKAALGVRPPRMEEDRERPRAERRKTLSPRWS